MSHANYTHAYTHRHTDPIVFTLNPNKICTYHCNACRTSFHPHCWKTFYVNFFFS